MNNSNSNDEWDVEWLEEVRNIFIEADTGKAKSVLFCCKIFAKSSVELIKVVLKISLGKRQCLMKHL